MIWGLQGFFAQQKQEMVDALKWKSLLPKRIQNASEFDLKRISFEIEFYLESVAVAAKDDELLEILKQIAIVHKEVESPLCEEDLEEYPLPDLNEDERKRLEFRAKFLQMPNLLESDTGSCSPLKPPSVDNIHKPLLFTHKDTDDSSIDDQLKQEELTEFLGNQASRLLENSRVIHSELLKDSVALTELENEIADKDIRLGTERNRLKQISASSWSTTLLVWVSVLVAILAFLASLVYLRLFSVIKVSHHPASSDEILPPLLGKPESGSLSVATATTRNLEFEETPEPPLTD